MNSLFKPKVKKGCVCLPFEGKDKLICLLCGGKTCKRCGLNAYLTLDRPALEKLHSTWITDSIVAMQRPNDVLISNFNLIEQFRRNRITSIFNLTEPGEHSNCGTGITSDSGFSYHPEYFMNAGIKHFNFNWRDMTVPTVEMMLNIVHIALNELCQGGKLAVHCHAGYGRTGTAIACIIIANEDVQAEEAINLVRQRRPGSIQTSDQVKFVKKFEIVYRQVINAFPVDILGNNLGPSSKTFKESIKDQFYCLSYDEVSIHQLKYFSKITYHSVCLYNDYLQENKSKRKIEKYITSFTGLSYKSIEDISSNGYIANAFELDYDTSFSLLNTKFINEIIADINCNNWTKIFNFFDIISNSDVDQAIVLGYFTESVKPTADLTINHTLCFMSQLLLHWIESRSVALFNEKLISYLRSIWLSVEDGSITRRRQSLADTCLHEDSSCSGSLSRSTSYGILPDIKFRSLSNVSSSSINENCYSHHSPVIVNLNVNQSTVSNDENQFEITNKLISEYIDKSLNQYELRLLQVIIKLINLTGQSNELSTPLSIHNNNTRDSEISTENVRSTLKSSDLLSLRLAIASTKAVSTCANLLTNKRAISRDLIGYYNIALNKSGFGKFVSNVMIQQTNIFDESLLSDVSIVWKTLLFLSNNNWSCSSKVKNIVSTSNISTAMPSSKISL